MLAWYVQLRERNVPDHPVGMLVAMVHGGVVTSIQSVRHVLLILAPVANLLVARKDLGTTTESEPAVAL